MPATSATRPRFRQRFLSRIDSAGSSAYDWYDEQLHALADPHGRWARVCAVVERLLVTAAFAVVCVVALMHERIMGAVVVAILLIVAVKCPGGRPPGPVSVLVAGVFATASVGLDGAVIVILAGWLAQMTIRPQLRDRIGALHLASVVAIMNPLVPSSWYLPAALVLLGVAGFAFLMRLVVTVPAPWNRVRARDLASVPPPPTRGALLRHLLSRFRGVTADVPSRITIKRAGGYAERRTALLLCGLARRLRARIVHDVQIPGATVANADHVVVSARGVVVLDTKLFGTATDPGTVHRDQDGVQHTTQAGSRSLMQSVTTLAWAATAVAQTLDVPAQAANVRAAIVVHSAKVQAGIRVQTQAQVVDVDVISADDLLAYLECDVDQPWNQSTVREIVGNLPRLRSASTGKPPHVVSSVGAASDVARGSYTAPSHVRAAAAQQPRDAGVLHDTSRSPRSAGAMSGDGAQDDVSAAVTQQVGDCWAQMDASEPTGVDDVPVDLRGVTRGDPVYVVDFIESDVQSHLMVAMSAPCRGRSNFLWVCTPGQWDVYARSGAPVAVSTVILEKVVRASTGGAPW